LTSGVDANGSGIHTRYDNSGNRVQLTDASFNTTRWQYDAQGQVLSETDPNRLSIVNEYDLVGNIAAVTDRRGYRTQFVRDNLDNVLREQWLQPSGSGVAFVSQIENWYDNYRRRSWTQQRTMATGQLSSIISLTIDDLDRVLIYSTNATPGQSAAQVTYQYDAFGNRTQRVQQTGAGGSLITVTTNYTEYDYLNRLTKLNQAATNFPSWQHKSVKLEYRDDSSLQTITRYSDLTQTTIVVKSDYTQDQAGRLASITHTKTVPSSTVLASYQYTYFADDQLLQEISSVDGTTNNDYDAYGQLVTSTKTAGTSEAYVYDKTGNRIVGSTVVGKGNRILNDGTYAFVYDANGNLTSRTTLVSGAPTGAYVQYSWDQRNQLSKVEFYNAPVNGTATLAKTVAYTYDDSSNRINKTLTVPGQAVVAENYVYDGDQLVAVPFTGAL
jgi:YD repeat-containing protein